MTQSIKQLQEKIKQLEIDAILIPGTDPHQSEYPPVEWELRKHFTGFKGSQGDFIVTTDHCLLVTDSRYELQVKKEVDADTVQAMIVERGTNFTHLLQFAQEKTGGIGKLAVDPRLLSLNDLDQLTTSPLLEDSEIYYLPQTFWDEAWSSRPTPSKATVRKKPPGIDSLTADEKINAIQQYLAEAEFDGHVVTDLESIARLLNIFGADTGDDQLVVSYLLILQDELHWFVDKEKLRSVDISQKVTTHDYDKFASILPELTQNKSILLDRRETTVFVSGSLAESSNVIYGDSPLIEIKQIKTPHEIDTITKTHINDAVALAEAFAELTEQLKENEIGPSEYEFGETLSEYRRQRPDFQALSFNPIIGYADNGAIVHYRANETDCKTIEAKSLLLVDSGGHYTGGTTDITRTLALGEPTEEQKKRYTQVLKGHLALNLIKIPKGLAPAHLETLARAPLLNDAKNYGHGTGHGVGYGTCVHESGANASMTNRNHEPITAGWVISNEPGYYEEGGFGIRIENLVATEEYDDKHWHLVQLSHFPYEPELIDLRELSNTEIRWINTYHGKVWDALKEQLSKRAAAYIQEKCRPLPLHD